MRLIIQTLCPVEELRVCIQLDTNLLSTLHIKLATATEHPKTKYYPSLTRIALTLTAWHGLYLRANLLRKHTPFQKHAYHSIYTFSLTRQNATQNTFNSHAQHNRTSTKCTLTGIKGYWS
jgi:hypothetical protein